MNVYLFPGQGAQFPGMGEKLKEIRSAAAILEEGNDFLGYDVTTLTKEQLAMTKYSQPATVLVSLASYRAWAETENPGPGGFYAGVSLGEYSAIAAAGCLSVTDTLHLINRRAALMQECCDRHPSTMSAVLGLDAETIEGILAEKGLEHTVYLANRNAPLQQVLAGPPLSLDELEEPLKDAGARRVVRLAVSGAFHTRYMEDAAIAMMNEFSDLELARENSGTVYSNYYAAPLFDSMAKDPDPSASRYLFNHMTRSVRWVEEVQAMAEAGADAFYEFGPGKVLSGLVAKILPGTRATKADC